MSQATSPSGKKSYGLARVCRVWEIPRSTVYSHKTRAKRGPHRPKKRGPKGPCSDSELTELIRQVLSESPFSGEGHRKVWARLRLKEVFTSKGRTLRLMRENNLLAPTRVGRRRGPRAHDGKITTQAPDLMWGTDMTSTVVLYEGTAHVFVAVDHCTGECVGIHAAKRGDRFEALEPIHQGVRERFGRVEKGTAMGLKLRHDHGSNYMSRDFHQQMEFLGLESSPAFVREPKGNGCAERFIRTLKENLLWVKHFETIEDLRKALIEFKVTYNTTWIWSAMVIRLPLRYERNLDLDLQEAA